VALSGHARIAAVGPLLGGKRTLLCQRHRQFESQLIGSQTANELFSAVMCAGDEPGDYAV
jgi:hypothetical protein